jgi:branched-subunit amino acid permease
MSRAFTFRRWVTWLFYLSSLIALIGAGEINSMLIGLYGVNYPSTVTSKVPLATQRLLQHPWMYTAWTKPAAVFAVLCTILIFQKSQSREAAYHYLSLLTLALYHLSFMAVSLFAVLFFLFPRLAGI